MDLRPGLSGSLTHTVAAEDTALALGSGDVPVLGTPRVLALAEAATVAALAGALVEGQTSVGTRVALRHRAPTAVGATVVASATVTAVEGSRVTFAVTVHEGDALVADGEVQRAVVDRESFLKAVAG